MRTSWCKWNHEYFATADGHIYCVNWRNKGQREMQTTPNSGGYPSVRLIINGKRKRFPVHKLVAAEHLPSRPSPKHEIRHLDGDKNNNKASNLMWGTAKENADDRARHGRTSTGRKHSLATKRGMVSAGYKVEVW